MVLFFPVELFIVPCNVFLFMSVTTVLQGCSISVAVVVVIVISAVLFNFCCLFYKLHFKQFIKVSTNILRIFTLRKQ